MSGASISQFDGRLVNQQRQINDRVFRLFDSSKYLTTLRSNISPCQKATTLILITMYNLSFHLWKPSKKSLGTKKAIKNEPAVFWPVGFLQIFLHEKIPRHSQLFSWAKIIDMNEKWDAKVFFFFSLSSSCTLSCSLRLNFAKSLLIFCLVRSVSTCEARSSASTSSSSFILTEEDFLNNQFLLRQIAGWSIKQFAALSTSQSGLCRLLNSIFGSHIRGGCLTTRLGDNSLLSEKRRLLFVFLKETIQSPPGYLGIVRQNFLPEVRPWT